MSLLQSQASQADVHGLHNLVQSEPVVVDVYPSCCCL